jgi:glutamyl-tRNA synthetase
VLHDLPADELLQKLLPLWQEKGWGGSGPAADSAWQADLCELLGPSLTLLADGVEQAAPFFERPVRDAAAAGQLAAEGAATALAAVADALAEGPLEPDAAKSLLDAAASAAGVKKGVVMKSMRAALLGSLQGPDLLATWGLLHRIGEDAPRLADAVQSSSRAE